MDGWMDGWMIYVSVMCKCWFWCGIQRVFYSIYGRKVGDGRIALGYDIFYSWDGWMDVSSGLGV